MNIDGETFDALWYATTPSWETARGIGMGFALSTDGNLDAERKRQERAATDTNIVRADNRRHQRAKRRRDYQAAPVLFSCVVCGVQWCKSPWVPGPPPVFCSQRCKRAPRRPAS
ncbi:MAG TPA: hypothetical protein VLT45_05915 [Kofleriaceae bacterium]|nr:hypothetical protein [Kofleriaceae bacterium]